MPHLNNMIRRTWPWRTWQCQRYSMFEYSMLKWWWWIITTISTCYIHHQFQHARFCRTIFQHDISFIEHAFFSCSNFNMLYSSPPIFNMSFQHARFCRTFFQHAVSFIEHAIFSCSNCNVGMVKPAWGMSVDNLRGPVGAKKRPSLLNGGIMRLQWWCRGGSWPRDSVARRFLPPGCTQVVGSGRC